MNEQLKAQIEEYMNAGKTPTWIATTLSIEDPNVDYDAARAYAAELQEATDYFKKKSHNPYEDSPLLNTGQPTSESSDVSSESSGPEAEAPIPQEDPQLQTVETPYTSTPTVKQLGHDYTERFQKDQQELYDQILQSDDQFKAEAKKIQESDASEEQKNFELNNLFKSVAHDRQRELLQSYADEINGFLPEDVDRTVYSNQLYRDHGIAIPLDGDDRYNQTPYAGGAVIDFFSDAALSLIAGTIDVVSGPLATVGSVLGSGAMYSPELMASRRRKIDQYLADFTDDIRKNNITRYTRDFTEVLGDEDFNVGDAGELLSRSVNTLGESAPYIALTAFTTPVGAAAVGGINSYVDSEREDFNREVAGLDRVFDDDITGDMSRVAMSAVDGALTGMAGKIQGALVKRTAQAILKNGMAKGTAGKFVKDFMLHSGLEIASEGGIEAIQEGTKMAFEDLLGNAHYTDADYYSRMQEAFTMGVFSSGVITAPAVVSSTIEGTADLVTRPFAASRSRVERSKMTGKDLDNINSLNDSKLDNAPEQEVGRVEREKFYRMMGLRHPQDMQQINDLDIAIEQAVIRHRNAKKSDASEAELKSLGTDIENLVRRREEIVKKHEGESTQLTGREQESYDHARIDHKKELARQRVVMLRERLEVLKSEAKIPFRVPRETILEVEQQLAEAVEYHKKTQGFIGEWGKAFIEARDNPSPEATKALDDLVADMKNHLGIQDIEARAAEPEQSAQVYSATAQLENHLADPDAKGSTFTLDGVNQAGRDKASVSIFPERSQIIDGDITAEDLESYVESNKDLFEGNEDVLSLGTWFDAKEGKTYIDVAATLDRDIAIDLGKQYNQKAVWDLKKMEEIDTGGSGLAEGDLKPESERIADIKNLLKTPEVEPEGDVKEADTEEARTTRGIEGEFDTYQAKKDGTLGITSLPGMTKKEMRFINGTLAKSLKKAVGNNFKIVAHRTKESGDRMSLKKQGSLSAMAINDADGSIQIHLNLPRLSEDKAAGKSPVAVLIEENLHAILGPTIQESLVNSPEKVFSLIDGLEKIALGSGNQQLVEQAREKGKRYKAERDASDSEVLEEVAVEYLSELLYLDFTNDTLVNRVRVQINKFIAAVMGKDAVMIDDISQAKPVLQKLRQSLLTGEAFVAPDPSSSPEATERAAMSPSKLPENKPFRIKYAKIGYNRFGNEFPAQFEERTFNGKWAFINWWKKATGMGAGVEPGSRVGYRTFSLERNDGTSEPINTDIMRSWNLRPPVFKRQAQEVAREKNRKKRNLIPKYFEQVNKKRRAEGGAASYASGTYRAALSDLEQVISESRAEELNKFKNRMSSQGLNPSQVAYEAFHKFAKYEEVEAAKSKFLSDNNLSNEDLVTERASYAFTSRIQEDPDLNSRFAKQLADKAEFLCGVGGGTCAANDKSSVLQAESSLVKSQIGDNPSIDESVAIAASALDIFRQHVKKDHGIDLAESVQNYAEGKADVMRAIGNMDDIKVDPSSFDIMYDLLVAYTSNGSTIDPNLSLANQLFVSGLKRIQSGATSFIRPGRIEALRKRERSGTLGFVNGSRANTMADHLIGINKIYDKFFADGSFDKAAFDEAVKRDDSGESPLRSMIGLETTKLANLALGNRGDVNAIPMDGHFRDQFNIYRGRFNQTDFSEGLVITEVARTSAIDRLNAIGGNVSALNSDAEIFAEIRRLKAEGDVATKNSAARVYKELTGNQIEKLRSFDNETMNEAYLFVNKLAKQMDLTPFQVQQLMYHDGIYAMSSYQGKPFISDYRSAMNRSLAADMSAVDLDGVPGDQMGIDFPEVDPLTESIMPTPGPKLVTKLGETRAAEANQLFRSRDNILGNTVRVNKQETVISDNMVQEALSTDATSRRIMAKGVEVEPGRKVGIRLNLNVRKNTGVPVQTMHERTASGEALQYAAGVTVKNAELFVNQNAREKIVTFQENKFPMASVNGEFVASGTDLNYDGVKAFFDPFRHNVFVDAAGRPIKSAGEATVVGSVAYLRGDIEYYSANDPILSRGSVESEQSRAKRLARGPKYDKALKRFEGYSKFVLGKEYETRAELEEAYDNMRVSSDVSINDSEVAERMGEAVERAAIRRTVKRYADAAEAQVRRSGENSIKQQIFNDPRNYITPQNLKELKRDIRELSDQELVDIVNDEQLGRISMMNDNMSVLAQAERVARAVARGESDRIPDLIAEIGAMGTTAGRLLRHLRDVKKASPQGLADTIKAAAEAKGNVMSEAREKQLKDITSRMFQQQAIVEDLGARAVSGEKVGLELKQATLELKKIENELDIFTNINIERGWGDLLGQIAQGNLLTLKSQMVNIGANVVNAVATVGTDITSGPIRSLIVNVGRLAGKEYDIERRHALGAYFYAMSHMGRNFVDTIDQVRTGQDKSEVEWRQSRSLMPFRSLLAAINETDVPTSQRMKLIVQGTLGAPAELMFRALSFGDVPFRKFFEDKNLYEQGMALGLEGEALTDFLKHPPRKAAERAKSEGKKVTFQEETSASKAANATIDFFEKGVASVLNKMSNRINGEQASKLLFRMMVPYRSTPANILLETATYASPLVAAARAAKNLKSGDVDSASQHIAKGMIGAVVSEAALLMISEGLMSGVIPWDEDEEKNLAYDQFPPTSINVSALKRFLNGEDSSKQEDDYFMNYMSLGTPGALMAAVSSAYDKEEVREREYAGPTDFAKHLFNDMVGIGPLSSAGSMMDQSFMQGVNEFLQILIGDNRERSAERLLNSLGGVGMSIVLPNQMAAVYRAQREYMPDRRVTKDMSAFERVMANLEYTIKDRMFNGSEIPIRHDWKGQPIKQNPRGNNGWMYQLFDITKMRQGESDPVSQEIYRLYEEMEEVSKIVSTPSFAKKRKLSVPNIKNRKEIMALQALGKNYSFLEDKEFVSSGVYLNTEELNMLMAIAGQERYAEAQAFINSYNYEYLTDEEKLKGLNEINSKYNSAKEYDGYRFKNHTIALLDIMQNIYEDEGRR